MHTIALRWTGRDPTVQLVAICKVNVMRTLREDKEAELRQLLNSNGGPQRIRELYEEVTGTKVPQVGYVNALIPAILDRHVENAEAAIMLKDHLPAPEQIPSLSPQAVGERLLFFFEEVILKRQQRTAIKRDYIGGTFPVRDYSQQLRTPITKVLLEGWDWLVNQGMIVKESTQDSFVLTRSGEDYLKRAKEKQGKFVIFYSWQSDLPRCRSFILECLEAAITAASAPEVQLLPCLDRDTQGEPGSPDIAETILDKIDACDMFVGDVSIISDLGAAKPTPNPNVLIELGYAARRLGWDRITSVFNTFYGKVEALPFDIRKRRVVTFSLKPEEQKAPSKKQLSEAFEAQIRACIAKGKAPA